MASLGDTVMLCKPGSDTEHLWIVITHPHPTTNKGIMVNVTTRRMHSDLTTILDVGDHPFIRKQSVVHYADARHFPVGALDRAVKSGECRPHKQASAALLARIQEGILKSPRTEPKIRRAFIEFEEAGLI